MTLMERSDVPNVFWILGAPSIGKASLNIQWRQHSPFQEAEYGGGVRSNGATTGHSDPRELWRSIAQLLSDVVDRGVKLDILQVLSETSDRLYPDDASIEDQFRQLICEPLQRQWTTSPECIIVVIHALDECVIKNRDEWDAFLGTIVRWSKEVPQYCKLVVATQSRTELDYIRDRLRLDTKDIVVEDWAQILSLESELGDRRDDD